MKIVVAVDSFRGKLSSREAEKAVEKGIRKIVPNASISKIPISDGRNGTVDALIEGSGGERISVKVNNPVMKKIDSFYGIMGDKRTAVIEMSAASGLHLLKENEKNPMKTTTYGTGELIKDAISRGCREFIVGIGGSATNDAGTGMLQALGFRFLDKDGNELGLGGEILESIRQISEDDIMPELKECKFLIACDTDNPFCGENGAAYIYASKKGADYEMIYRLDYGLRTFAEIIKLYNGKDVTSLAGAGAAGGLGGGFIAFLNAEAKSGIEIILDKLNFNKYLRKADMVLTGGDSVDQDKIEGRTPFAVATRGKIRNIPVVGIIGEDIADFDFVHECGIDAVFRASLNSGNGRIKASTQLEKSVSEIFRVLRLN